MAWTTINRDKFLRPQNKRVRPQTWQVEHFWVYPLKPFSLRTADFEAPPVHCATSLID